LDHLKEVPSRCVNSGLAITRRNFEVDVMQFKQNTIQILDARGQIIATMALPADIKLTELAPLKILGDISFKVLPGAAPSRGICLGGVA
jgi:hypothetical protein